MSKRPSPRPCLQALKPYVPGRPLSEVKAKYGLTDVVKLASNENPLGPSPLALAAAQRALGDVHRYPDGGASALRAVIAKRFDVPPGRVVVGAGAAELIDLAMRTFIDPGEEVVVPEGIFRMFPVAVGRSGGKVIPVPTHPDLRPDLAEIRKHVSDQTKVVAIANPNNPTGSYVTHAELAAYFDGLPGHVLTILDEAYFEFAHGVVPDYPNGLDFLARGHAVLVLRTLSKIAGLAGLRIGYGFAAEDVVSAIDRVREPFNTSGVAQAAAVAALGDDEHMTRVRDLTIRERELLRRELAERGLLAHPSIANFLLVELPSVFAPLESEFEMRGVIVRPMAGWGFPRCFRLSIGTRAENERFLAVLDDILEAGLVPGAHAAAPVSVEAAG